MENELKKAKAVLLSSEYTCVVSKDGTQICSKERGVKPLLKILESSDDLSGAVAADRVVGKAAAYLYVLMHVKSVYSTVISNCAKEVFDKFYINCYYDTIVDRIENRTKTGLCPMESAVIDIDNPLEAKEIVIKKLSQLN